MKLTKIELAKILQAGLDAGYNGGLDSWVYRFMCNTLSEHKLDPTEEARAIIRKMIYPEATLVNFLHERLKPDPAIFRDSDCGVVFYQSWIDSLLADEHMGITRRKAIKAVKVHMKGVSNAK